MKYLSVICEIIQNLILVSKNLVKVLYGTELDVDIDKFLAMENDYAGISALRRAAYPYLNIQASETVEDPSEDPIDKTYTCHMHYNEEYKYFQNMKFSMDTDKFNSSYIKWVKSHVDNFTCDITLFGDSYITIDQMFEFTSGDAILEYIINTFQSFDIFYKYEHQPMMIVQIMTPPGLFPFMHHKNTVGYMGIHLVPLVDFIPNPIITRISYNPCNHGIRVDFNNEHNYFEELYESSSLQYMFIGDTKPAKQI